MYVYADVTSILAAGARGLALPHELPEWRPTRYTPDSWEHVLYHDEV